MFYHIRIDYFDKKLKVNQTLYEYDYSTEDEVINKIVSPYLSGGRLVPMGTNAKVILLTFNNLTLRLSENSVKLALTLSSVRKVDRRSTN